VDEMIPINAVGQRLDYYMIPPRRSQLGRYHARCKVRKLRNAFRLDGGYRHADCEFDNRSLDRELQHVMRFASGFSRATITDVACADALNTIEGMSVIDLGVWP
jgi:hypothetical protein